MKFKIKTNLIVHEAQQKSIDRIVDNIKRKENEQIFLGVTGAGKTFTMAKVIEISQLPTLIMVHNKTLVMQFREILESIFPENSVVCYISDFDYYRPEAYNPSSDSYFGKKTNKNIEIGKMRVKALHSLITRKDTIVICSVAALYGSVNPSIYEKNFFNVYKEKEINEIKLIEELKRIGYSEENKILKIEKKNKITEVKINFLGEEVLIIELKKEIIIGLKILNENEKIDEIESYSIPPFQYVSNKEDKIDEIINEIKKDLENRNKELKEKGRILESERLTKIIEEDLKNLKEFGYCSGIENYSKYFDKRKTDEAPYVIMDFFKKNGDFLTIIDESHVTIPQIRAMYNTDKSRKKNLIDYGFRLPSSLDNRPISFEEFMEKTKYKLYISATPGKFEESRINETKSNFTEQLIRPTGLLDPKIIIKNPKFINLDILEEIKNAIIKKGRVIIYTLTKIMAEDFSNYLQENKVKAIFIHSEMNVLERYQVISSLRRGTYDVIVGINLLKEGIDIPEVSLICIIDADKPGFLRDKKSLIQIIGRAARNIDSRVIFYAEKITKDIESVIKETDIKRNIQMSYNLKNKINPASVIRKIRNSLIDKEINKNIEEIKLKNADSKEVNSTIKRLKIMMKKSAGVFNFEKAIAFRDAIIELENYKIDIEKREQKK